MSILLVSMEAALKNEVNTYAGGLGILVGDKLRAARDMKLDLDVITFAYPGGYVKHKIENDKILCEPNPYNPRKFFKVHDEFNLKTKFGNIPITLLRGKNSWLIQTDFAKRLYIEKNDEARLKKEIIFGLTAAKVLKENNYDILHLEESHAAFIVPKIQKKRRMVFTTHTPLPHGHEVWPKNDVKKLFGKTENNLTKLALSRADYVNCVSRMHRDVANEHLGGRADYVTNGVHISWMHKKIQKLAGTSPEKLIYAHSLSTDKIASEKDKMRRTLARFINENAFKNKEFKEDVLTIGIARRFTGYKRLDMILKELSVLENMAEKTPLQIVFAGMAHPNDISGIKMIEYVIGIIEHAKHVSLAYLPYYDMEIAKTMIAGSDVWLNLPYEEKEASGTSWMKAMMNGTILISTQSGSVPEFSVHNENSLLLPYGDSEIQRKTLLKNIKLLSLMGDRRFEMARNAIATSSRLTAKRMMNEYLSRAYLLEI